MANTYTQIHIQAVFAVKYRQSLIHQDWEDELFKIITGTVQNYGHKLLQINGTPDHIHLLFGFRPTQSLSGLIQEVKEYSSGWINKRGFISSKFNWQSGYGAFSYSKSQVPRVINYIQNQKEHHRKKTFLDEYRQLLKTHEIDFDERYIFQPLI